MIFKAQDTRKNMALLDPNAFRFPQGGDRFKLHLTTDLRQYVVVNTGSQYRQQTRWVTFKVVGDKKLVSCTCPDFAYHRTHLRLCKHIHVAYYFHVSRMNAIKKAEKAAAAVTA